MRRGDRDRGSLPSPASDAKNIRLKLSFARVMTAASGRASERGGRGMDADDDDAARYIDSLQRRRMQAIMTAPRQCLAMLGECMQLQICF